MNSQMSVRIFALLFAGFLVVAPSQVMAQEPGDAPSASEVDAISQGRVAVLLANSLGFYVGQDGPLSPERAVALLMQNGISPMDGWKINDMVKLDELAVILGQALGLDTEFTDEQKSDPSAQAYKDALIEEFGLDLKSLVKDAVRVTLGPNPNEGNPGFNQPVPFGPDHFVSTSDLDQVIAAVIPAAGGDSGQVDDGSDNITPSAP